MAWDVQMRLVYAWEREAYPGYFDKARSVGVPEAREMIRKVHADVRSAGGFAHEAPVVKFTKRNGSACASWGRLKFTPSMLTPEIVLHEIAHSLTWHSVASREVMRTKNLGTPLAEHALRRFCTQGHGPRYVACFIALCERYAGHSADAALALARGFKYQAWGPWRTIGSKCEGGRTTYHRERAKVTRFGSVRVDLDALAYWRGLLNGGK